MKVKEKKWIRIRIYLVAVFFLFVLSTILFRAVQLQVFESEKLKAIASSGYRTVVNLPPKRGTILDREGDELAISVEVGSIYANPRQVNDKTGVASQLALNLEMSSDRILSLLKKDRSFVWIKRKISPRKIDQIKSIGLKGVGFTKETKRFFPGREIAGHMLGIVGSDNQGLEGVEKKYDEILKGSGQSLVQMRDALGRSFFVSKPADVKRDVHNLVLTIDKDIQYKAQQALDRAVEKAKGKSGQCLIMDPETGEILAMATSPAFDPNLFRQHRPSQWRNRVVTDCYEPGSSMKVFLLAAALEMNIISPGTKFYCEEGEYRVGNTPIRDTKKHLTLSASDIVVLSSNIGAIKIGNELGYSRFYEYLNKFGFGQKTNIDLIGERKGSVRPPNRAREVDRANAFFGQGMTSTSLQLANAIAVIANGGRLMRPYVVKAIKDESGNTIKEYHPHLIRRVISPKTAKTVANILEGVVSDRGTAPLAFIEGYRAAGKTSTAQKVDPSTKKYSNKDYMAVFVGFAPVNNPRLVILVMVEEPRGVIYGGDVAGPVFKKVGKWALNRLNVQPRLKLANMESINHDKNKIKIKRDILSLKSMSDDNILPDFRGLTMREVLKNISALGLSVTLEGSGLAVNQTPGPGSSLKEITSVKVSFRPPA